MSRAISCAKNLLIAGLMAVSLIGFAGVASAASSCWGKIPAGSAHQPFSMARRTMRVAATTTTPAKQAWPTWAQRAHGRAITPRSRIHHGRRPIKRHKQTRPRHYDGEAVLYESCCRRPAPDRPFELRKHLLPRLDSNQQPFG